MTSDSHRGKKQVKSRRSQDIKHASRKFSEDPGPLRHQASLLATIEATSDFVGFADAKTRHILYMNRAGRKMTGIGEDEDVTKLKISDVHPRWTNKMFSNEIFPTAIRDGLWSGECAFLNRDGYEIPVSMVLLAHKKPSGEVERFSTISRDITERKGLEKKLQQSEYKLRKIFASSPDAITMTDINGNIIECNQATLNIHGFSSKYELIGKSLFELIAKRDQARATENMKKTLDQDLVRNVEYACLTRNEQEFPAEISSGVVKDALGNATGFVAVTRDVTERRRLEEELRAAKERMNFVLSSNPAVLFTAEPKPDLSNLIMTSITSNVSSLLGFEPQEFMLHPDFRERHCYPDDIKVFKGLVSALWKEGHYNFEYRFLHKDGSYRWINEEANVLRDPKGNITEIIGYWTDITERKQIEKELRATRERLEYVVASNPAVIYAAKPRADHADFVLTYLSERVVSLLGFESQEFIGHPEFWERHVHPDSLRAVLEQMPRLWKEGKHTFEYQVMHKDGTYRWIREEASVVRDADGKPIEINGYWTDVTERKEMEDRLRDSEERFRGIAESSFDTIATLTLDHEIDYASPAIERLTGYTPDEVTGKRLAEFLSKEEIVRAYQGFAGLDRGEPVMNLETEMRRKDGSPAFVELNATPIYRKQGRLGVVAILRDVTEKRHVELLRDRFISAVTHELRTPLGPLQLHVDYALSGKLGPIPEKIRSSLQVVKRNTDHLVQLTDDLLDIRRIESGMFQLALEPTDFLEILEQTMTEIQVSLDMRRQSIHVEVPKGSLIVQGDRIRLKQVLINLLSNASKFTSEQGKIAIRIEDRTDTIQVQISDTGIGISKQDLPRVFKPFAAIQKPTYIKGTGLGLSITKGIIEAHGGNIMVKSDGVGNGSTFTFTLPKRKGTS